MLSPVTTPENGDREQDWSPAEPQIESAEPGASVNEPPAPPRPAFYESSAADQQSAPDQQVRPDDVAADLGGRHTADTGFFGRDTSPPHAEPSPAPAASGPQTAPPGGEDPTTWLTETEVAELRRKAADAMQARRAGATHSPIAGEENTGPQSTGAHRIADAEQTGPQAVYHQPAAQSFQHAANHGAPDRNYGPQQSGRARVPWPQQPIAGQQQGYGPAGYQDSYQQRYAVHGEPTADSSGLAHAFRHERHTTVTKPEPQSGWRKAILASTFGLVNPGESKVEREDRERRARVCANVSPVFIYAVLSGKGGASKTTTTAGVGSMFAACRGGGDVVVIDANPDEGNLASRVNPDASHTFVDVLRARTIQSRSEIRNYTKTAPTSQLDVLAGSQVLVNPARFSPETFSQTIHTLANVYSVIGIDCGTNFHTPLMQRVLDTVTAVVVVTGVQFDSGKAAMRVHDWLVQTGRGELVQRSFLLMSEHTPQAQPKLRADIEETVGKTAWKDPIYVPYDPHLYEASVIDLAQLRKRTSRAYLQAAAKLSNWYGAPPVPVPAPAQPRPDRAGGRR